VAAGTTLRHVEKRPAVPTDPAPLVTDALETRTLDADEPETEVLETDVLVVGAGPTGLMAGLILHRRGVDSLVVDGKHGPTRESRALVVQARSMEIYDQLGLAEQMLTGGNAAARLQFGPGTAPGVEFGRVQEGWTSFPGAQVFEHPRDRCGSVLAG